MQVVKQYPSGTFSWVDLVTTDAAGAKQFYTELFGWQSHDMPTGPEGVYTMLLLEDHEVAALYQMDAEQRSQQTPSHWLSYISVDNCDALVEQAQTLGATIVQAPYDVMDAGRMALIQDPTGARFALWQPGQHIGAKLVNIPGSLCWNELATRDSEQARVFYTALFGWETQDTEMATGMTYTSYQNQGRMAAGMMQITAEWGDVPSNWSIYFAVENCDATVAKAQELGATMLMGATDIPETGRFAVLQDPQGAFSM
ncbi:MAG: VOC family protein [Chloroflexaceae bacterium]|nr:VOC family protein [Chloroflexaceae bacterium]